MQLLHGSGQIEGTCCKHSCSFYKSLDFTGVCWVVLSHRLIAVTSVSIQFNNKMIRCWGHISQIVTISTAKAPLPTGTGSFWTLQVQSLEETIAASINHPSATWWDKTLVERGPALKMCICTVECTRTIHVPLDDRHNDIIYKHMCIYIYINHNKLFTPTGLHMCLHR